MNEKMTEVFFEEATDLLNQLEDKLLELEDEPENSERVSAVFRIMHTIKGSAGMFGFDEVSKFTHGIETAYDLVRSGKLEVSKPLITFTLQSRDLIMSMLNGDLSEKEIAERDMLTAEFLTLTNQSAEILGDTAKKTDSITDKVDLPFIESLSVPTDINLEQGVESTFRICFKPSLSVMFRGIKPLGILRELQQLGVATVVPYFGSIPPLSEIEPEKCYVSWDIILTTAATKDAIQDVFIFLDSESSVQIEKLDIEKAQTKRLGEILVERGLIDKKGIDNLLQRQKKLGDILVEENIVSRAAIDSALAEQLHVKKVAQIKKTSEQDASNTSIRVSSEKLDQLIDLVGELVTFDARLGQLTLEMDSPSLASLFEHGERLILSLRDTTMDMRMLPIGTIFSRFKRLVRDLASDLGKSIDLTTEGAETEMDKTVIEKLNDPLVHLIRNAVDHGIESREDRTLAGKDVTGQVKLSAHHAGAFVIITVSDDGAGLDADRIRAKAIERGVISSQEEYSNEDIYDIIFEPGFSTNTEVTAVSGRGVGMDVVRKNILSLGGTISIETEKGRGTSFILKLPLTLAIIEGMLVHVGDGAYVIPLSSVVECIEFDKTETSDDICSCINVRGEYMPFINLRSYFGCDDENPQNRQVVVVNDQDSKIGLVVDTVIGNYQTVIKPLGRLYRNIEGFSGATILGDGSVAIILDVYKLSALVRKLDIRNV